MAAPAANSASSADLPEGYIPIRNLTVHDGMDCVWLAYDQAAKREVVLKLMRESWYWDPYYRERFRREGYWLRELDPAAVVKGYSYTEATGRPCIVMEYIDGSDLAEVLRSSSRLSVAAACDLALQVASCLSVVHAAEVLHRDVKLENAMLSRDRRVRLIDFGLAGYIGEGEPPPSRHGIIRPNFGINLTSPDTLMGTITYAPYEQLMALPDTVLDYRADQYALGVSLYELLTGSKPFTGNSVVTVLLNQEQRAMQRVREVRPDVPVALAQAVERMLALLPDDRYDSVADAAADIKRAMKL